MLVWLSLPSPDDLQRAGKRSGLPHSIRMRLPASLDIYLNPKLGESSGSAALFLLLRWQPLIGLLWSGWGDRSTTRQPDACNASVEIPGACRSNCKLREL
jgi:hypothetical protein